MRAHGRGRSTYTDADAGCRLITKRHRVARSTQVRLSCSGIADRYAQVPVRINEEQGHLQTRLFHVAAPIALALREPNVLGHDRAATRHDMIIEKPSLPSIKIERGLSPNRRLVPNEEGSLMKESLDI
jgi:hypothetical protein